MTDRDTYSEAEALLPIGEAARLLGFSVETIRRWTKAGVISCIRTPGNQRRYTRAEVERVLADLRSGKAAS